MTEPTSMLTTIRDFVELVRRMRDAQKAFFRDRTDVAALALAKGLEREVDQAVRILQRKGNG